MMIYDFDKYKTLIENRLSPESFEHSVRVSDCAALLGERFDVDAEKLRIAGILHDYAKEIDPDTLLHLAIDGGVKITKNERECPHRLHGKVGALLVERELGITDPEILSGIANHYGVVGMKPFEEVVFLADMYDRLRRYDYDVSLDKVLESDDLDDAVMYILQFAITGFVDNDEKMSTDVAILYDFIITKRSKNDAWGRDGVKWLLERKSVYDDESFDILLKVCMEHSTGLESLNNARDLGGYRTEDGRTVAKHKIIRSAALSRMTKEDADRLYDMGINTIIDFRAESGRKKLPDINTEKFRCIPCEMASFVKSDYQKEISEMVSGSDGEHLAGDMWLNGQFLREFNVEEMYRANFTAEKSAAGLKQMLDIMLDDETTGVLIHCRDGKDRTGVAAFIILILLGVSEDDYICDYMASAVSTFAITELANDFFEFFSYDEGIVANSRREKSVDYNLMVAVSDWMIEKYGTDGAYFRDVLKIDEDYVRRLREKFLE